MPDPIPANCKRDYYPALKQSGNRSRVNIWWVVLHSAEGDTARGVGAWFQNPDAQGSTHLAVDDKECQRFLPNSAVCWGAKGANFHGFHIEQCGYAKWSTVIWRSHLATLKRAAYKTAFHCVKFGIPPVFIKAADLKAGRKGVTTHVECSKAFGGTHWDPGKGWPRWGFMWLVRHYHGKIQNV